MASIGAFNGSGSTLINPNLIGFKSMNFQGLNNIAFTQSNSGRTIRKGTATMLWRATLEFPFYTQDQFREIQAFQSQARGRLNDFTIELPGISSKKATAAVSTMTAKDASDVGSTAVDVALTGWTSGTILKAGDVIKFSNHSKVYMVTGDVTPDSAGDVQINFQPSLIKAVAISDTVTFDNVPFKMIMANDAVEYQYNTDGTVNYRMDVQEAI
ncbi:MAG: hypothetical protein Tp123DCM190181_28 [Prokaryotic dsDNA virus sp.]|jgi:hypothetical protein|nr:MAG: hypothetical protein Tp123DCM190181_28 [Prokaryotic dsDNA virus sp.]|tara:strand:+ start:1384 stop:2022 length:639 start_codon:yes stop_codon:yes gene_type:complete